MKLGRAHLEKKESFPQPSSVRRAALPGARSGSPPLLRGVEAAAEGVGLQAENEPIKRTASLGR